MKFPPAPPEPLVGSFWLRHRFGLTWGVNAAIPKSTMYLARLEAFGLGWVTYRPWTFEAYVIADEHEYSTFQDRQVYLGMEDDLSWLLVDRSAFYPFRIGGSRQVTLDPGYNHVMMQPLTDPLPDESSPRSWYCEWLEFLTYAEPPKPTPKVKTRSVWDRLK